jgi:hypothetical protein
MGGCGTKAEVNEPRKARNMDVFSGVKVSPDIFVSLKEGTLS